MSLIYNFFQFFCCKKKQLPTDIYDDISSSGEEWYNEWGKEFDKSSSLRKKHSKFYSSIPHIETQTE